MPMQLPAATSNIIRPLHVVFASLLCSALAGGRGCFVCASCPADEIRVRADTKRVLCHAVIAADLHQPLLALLHIHPTSMGSSKVPLLSPCASLI